MANIDRRILDWAFADKAINGDVVAWHHASVRFANMIYGFVKRQGQTNSETLASSTLVSPNTLNSYLRILEEYGLIEVHRQPFKRNLIIFRGYENIPDDDDF